MKIFGIPSRTKLSFSIAVILLFFVSLVTSQETVDVATNGIQGIVVDVNGLPVQNATIQLKNSFVGTMTDDEGKFTVNAEAGDTLVFSAFLMNDKEVTAESDMRVRLEPNAELLESVLLSQRSKAEDTIRTPFKNTKKNALGYSRRTLETKDFWPGDQTIYESIIRNPLVTVVQGQLFYERGLGAINRTPVLIILDGVPVGAGALLGLHPTQVESLSFVRSLAGTIKYGQLGAGGVIYVKTKLTAGFDEEESEVYPLTVSGNNYSETLISLEESVKESEYISRLKSTNTFGEAQAMYQQHTLELGLSSLDYYLEAADYFTKWDLLYSHDILSNLIKWSNNNPNVLMGIAYQCEQLGRFHQAAYLYEELMIMRPDRIQSYLDLAQVYTQIGHYELANSLYKQMLYNKVPNMDFTPVESVVISEYRRFLSKYRHKVNFRGLPNELLIPVSKKSVWIVMEWTNPLAEFEIQFVSPQKKYYNWSHTAFESKDDIERELELGYAIKDFILEDDGKGEWIVNIKPISTDEGELPTFVKYTLYKNFGLNNESMEVKVVPLNKVDQKVTLDAIVE